MQWNTVATLMELPGQETVEQFLVQALGYLVSARSEGIIREGLQVFTQHSNLPRG